MNNGWIKLHRKSLESEVFKDQVAWVIFCWLLLRVDRKTGKTTLGRFWASKELKLKPSTFYKGLKRLENNYKIINLVTKKVTIKYTEVSVLNWHKYQGKDDLVTQDGNNSVTIKEQSSNTLQEYKNKEYKKYNRESITPEYLKELKLKFPNHDVELELEKAKDWLASTGKVKKDYKAFFRNWLRRTEPSKMEVIRV